MRRGSWRWSLYVAMILPLLCSCTYFSQFSNRGNAAKLRVGMSKEETLAVMGEPLKDKKFNSPDVWYYYIETLWGFDCQATRDECMPVVFVNGRIAGWGDEYYKKNITLNTGK